MGDVYLAHDPNLERPVAIKVLRSAHQDDLDFRARFEREARAVARLRHPNIVIIFDFGVDEESPFMAMEYIAGITLKELLAGVPVPPLVRRLEVVEDLCRGLAHAHRHEIIHRDIKPVNLMIDGEGVLKILDFGIARIGESQTQSGIMGTFPYMSPEQALGLEIGKASDIFAVGSVLYETLTLRQAFPGDGAAPLQKIVAGEYVPVEECLPGIDPQLAAVVRRALQHEPGNRHASVKELQEELTQIRKRLAASGDEAADVSSRTIVAAPARAPRSESGSADSDRRRGLTPEREAALRQLQVEEYVQSARAALASKNYEAAVLAAERALTLDRNNRAALTVIDEARFASEATAVRRLFVRVRELEEQRRLDEALAVAREAQGACTALPDVTAARSLQSEARDLVDQISAARERQQTIDRSLTHARQSVDSGEFETALRAVYQVLALDPDHIEARSIEQRAQTRLREQREQERARRLALEQVAAARALAAQGGYSDALTLLDDIRSDSGTVRSAADEARGVILAAQKQAAAAKIVDDAQRALHRREFAAAIAALEAIPEAELNQQARAVKAAAQAALEQQREAERRRRALDEMIGAIQALADRGDFEQALDRLRAAAELGPADERVRALRQRVSELSAAAEAKRHQESLDRQAAARVASARDIAARGELMAAVALLEEAEAPHPLIDAALFDLRERIEQERLRREAAARERAAEEARKQAAAAAARRAEEERQLREQKEREESARLRAEAARLQEEAARKAEVERQRQRDESTVLISAAEAALAAGHLEQATVLLGRAEPIVPGDEDELATRVSTARAQIRRQEEVLRRERSRREQEARDAEVERQRREAIEAAEKAAAERRAEEKRQAELARDRERIRARDAEVTRLVAAAADEESPAAALKLLEAALELAPGDRKITSLITTRQEQRRQLDAESARLEAIDRAQSEIDVAVQRGDLDEAQRLLISAERRFEPASFRALRVKLDAQRRAARAAAVSARKDIPTAATPAAAHPWYRRPAVAGPIAAALLLATALGAWWSWPSTTDGSASTRSPDRSEPRAPFPSLEAIVKRAQDQYNAGDRIGAIQTSLDGLRQQEKHPPLVSVLQDIRRDLIAEADAARARAVAKGAEKTDEFRSADSHRTAADQLSMSDLRNAVTEYEAATRLYGEALSSLLPVQQLMQLASQAYNDGQLAKAVTYAEQVIAKDRAHKAARQILLDIRSGELREADQARATAVSAQASDQPAFSEGDLKLSQARALDERNTSRLLVLLDDAVKNFEAAVATKNRLDDDRARDADKLHQQARESLKRGDFDKAKQEVDQSLALVSTADARQTRSAIEEAIRRRNEERTQKEAFTALVNDIETALASDQARDRLLALQTRAAQFPELRARIDSELAKLAPLLPPPPPVDIKAVATNEIQRLLDDYIAAYSRLDEQRLREIFPRISIPSRSDIRSVQVRLEGREVKVAEDGLTATVTARQVFQYQWKVPGLTPTGEGVVSWRLVKRGTTWQIENR
jgi:serine/threonine protein kinase